VGREGTSFRTEDFADVLFGGFDGSKCHALAQGTGIDEIPNEKDEGSCVLIVDTGEAFTHV